MVWIIKKGVFTLLSSEYRHWARTVNSLKAWFTRATQMQMQEPTTFIRQNQTQGRQNTQEQSRTVKLFPRWRSRVKLILRVLKGRKKYLFNATENIRLYGIQFIWLYLLFIFFIVIHTVFLSLGSFAKSFQARIYLHNVYHKAPYISLYYLLISRLVDGACFFFIILAFAFAFAFPRFTCVKCKRKRKWKQTKMKLFPFLALALTFALM